MDRRTTRGAFSFSFWTGDGARLARTVNLVSTKRTTVMPAPRRLLDTANIAFANTSAEYPDLAHPVRIARSAAARLIESLT